jgi:hypothetical protein
MVKTQSQTTNTNGNDEEEYSIANEKISLELILSDWNKEQEQVSRVIEYNRQAGIRKPRYLYWVRVCPWNHRTS